MAPVTMLHVTVVLRVDVLATMSLNYGQVAGTLPCGESGIQVNRVWPSQLPSSRLPSSLLTFFRLVFSVSCVKSFVVGKLHF